MNYSTKNSALLPKIRKVLMKYNFALIMGLQVAFFSCTKDKVAADLSTPKVHNIDAVKSSTASNEDVFRGLVFLRGEVAGLFPEYQDLSIERSVEDPQRRDKAIGAQEQMLSYIKQKYPQYLESFRHDVTSGDYNKVYGALKGAAEKVAEAGTAISGKSIAELNAMSQGMIDQYSLSEASTAQDAVSVLHDTGVQELVGVVVVVAVAVAVAAVYAWVWFWEASISNAVGDYTQAEMSSAVTVKMAGFDNE